MNQEPEKSPRYHELSALGLGLLSALFFTMTYVLNRVSATEGGHWAWTACLRYFITLPLLWVWISFHGGVTPVLNSLRKAPWAWLKCSSIGFGIFYTFLCYGSSSGPSWLIAGSFQFTVVAGMLCAPFLYRDHRKKIPISALLIALLTFSGVLLMQWGHHGQSFTTQAWMALGSVILSAIAYPLGNRMLLLHLEKSGESLNATQRVFGMTLASQPVWLGVSLYAGSQVGLPSLDQIALASGVAVSAGIIATILFFKATAMVKHQPAALGSVEAMQAAELLIAVLIGGLFLHEPWPHGLSLLGACAITTGILAFAWLAAKPKS